MNRLLLGSLSAVVLFLGACGGGGTVSEDAAAPPAETQTEVAESTPETTAPETPATEASGSEVAAAAISMGSFVSGEHPTQGTASVIEENGQRFVELGEDFNTDEGPDLYVILHRSNDVIGTTEAPAHSIQEGDYVTLAPLESVSGTQRYEIPADVNIADYQSVAIWCQQFNATFGAAALAN
ncbi:MAG: DM13 domain-containing protein [Synechococcales bacterium]|nr:DM13 domain-containing protein [Synechococcales bacterium]